MADDEEQARRLARTRLFVVGGIVAVVAVVVAVVFVSMPPRPKTWADLTGVPPGTSLRTVNGDIEITEAGTVVDGVDVHGRIIVRAPDVTIRNSVVRGADSGSREGLIDAMEGQPGLKVINTEVYAAVPSPYVNGIMGSHFTLQAVDIHDVIDQVHVVGDDVTVTGSWLHANLHYENDPTHDNGPSHDDNVQIQIGSRITVEKSRLSGAHNAVVQITQDRGVVSDVTFVHNRANGGWCSINVSLGDYGPIAGVTVENNVFGRSQRLADCAIISPPSTQIALAHNRFTNGEAVTVRRGA
ncbi:hypothetical protein [Naasia aerilata]|uniref:Right handed beta helix domain-containing protein n=1 Tax=Naasia aerilata TaxID=1162966 RepID=A0ABN6XR90_9MICO|nr:hypothetical protein [Naasia aerilata]BDZ45938.1 hypothetical protein GCM10025866_18470 [Naasia aerilata]